MSYAQSIDCLYQTSMNLSKDFFSVEFCSVCFLFIKSPAQFTSLLSDIRLDIQTNMNDNQTGQNPIVRFFRYIRDKYVYRMIFRTFENEKWISIREEMLKKYDDFSIIVKLMQRILRI